MKAKEYKPSGKISLARLPLAIIILILMSALLGAAYGFSYGLWKLFGYILFVFCAVAPLTSVFPAVYVGKIRNYFVAVFFGIVSYIIILGLGNMIAFRLMQYVTESPPFYYIILIISLLASGGCGALIVGEMMIFDEKTGKWYKHLDIGHLNARSFYEIRDFFNKEYSINEIPNLDLEAGSIHDDKKRFMTAISYKVSSPGADVFIKVQAIGGSNTSRSMPLSDFVGFIPWQAAKMLEEKIVKTMLQSNLDRIPDSFKKKKLEEMETKIPDGKDGDLKNSFGIKSPN